MSQRVLVTGAQGFTGHHMVAKLLALGYEVWGLGSGQTTPTQHYHFLAADLADPQALTEAIKKCRPNYVIHLAGIAFVDHRSPTAFYNVNLIGTHHLLQALETHARELKCILLASSANVYGNGLSGLLSELAPTHPANDYAVSKLAMEYMAQLWLDRLPIVIARPFNYTGVEQSTNFLIPKIVSHFLAKKEWIELGNLDVWREFNDVRDVTAAYARLIKVAPLGKIINICSGNLHSLREVLDLTANLTHHTLEIKVNPSLVRPNEVISLGGDPSLLCHYVSDWNPHSLSETLEWMTT
jgi:nucleoside-diphosphate-sugar epimerase